jgi:hypothetical protein
MISGPKTPNCYRERADECDRVLVDAVNPETREIMLYLAARWRALADEDEVEARPELRASPAPLLPFSR